MSFKVHVIFVLIHIDFQATSRLKYSILFCYFLSDTSFPYVLNLSENHIRLVYYQNKSESGRVLKYLRSVVSPDSLVRLRKFSVDLQ